MLTFFFNFFFDLFVLKKHTVWKGQALSEPTFTSFTIQVD